TFDPALLPDRPLLSVAMSMQQDRSWHAIDATIIHRGRRWSTADRLSLSDDGYRELTFKLQYRDGLDERKLGIYPLVAEDGAGLADAPTLGDPEAELSRIELTVTRRSGLGAAWAKYTQAYYDAWYADNNWPRYLFNSLLLVGLSVFGQLLSCSMVAYAFSRLRWAGREFLFGVVLATMMLPAIVMMIPAFMIFKTAGLYNTLVPLWLPAFFGTPFFIFLLRQFMLAIPRDLEEAALIDGCSWYGIYWRIILPLMKPALAAVAIFTFMNVWNEFMGPLIYLSDARKFPLSLGLFNFRSENDSNFAMLMAASTMMTLPVIMLFFFCQRYFIEGVTLTGVKG
ncbi:MAG: carbohydrate ABC transporter permease, partial [Planctomycetota bacterium]